MPRRPKTQREKGRQPSAAALAASDFHRRPSIRPLPLQKEFESLRRFAEGFGLTAEKLVRMARSLERYPLGKKKGVLESLRALAEQRRIPYGRLIRLAETISFEPELARQIESVKAGPSASMGRSPKGARRGRRAAAAKEKAVKGAMPQIRGAELCRILKIRK